MGDRTRSFRGFGRIAIARPLVEGNLRAGGIEMMNLDDMPRVANDPDQIGAEDLNVLRANQAPERIIVHSI